MTQLAESDDESVSYHSATNIHTIIKDKVKKPKNNPSPLSQQRLQNKRRGKKNNPAVKGEDRKLAHKGDNLKDKENAGSRKSISRSQKKRRSSKPKNSIKVTNDVGGKDRVGNGTEVEVEVEKDLPTSLKQGKMSLAIDASQSKRTAKYKPTYPSPNPEDETVKTEERRSKSLDKRKFDKVKQL